jgi:hypothetical protein
LSNTAGTERSSLMSEIMRYNGWNKHGVFFAWEEEVQGIWSVLLERKQNEQLCTRKTMPQLTFPDMRAFQ